MTLADKRVVIVGGGLSGLAAAVVLAHEGFQITLTEKKPFLGGRASSYPVPGSEDSYVDNCQHVLLKSCTNLIDFYERLGTAQEITYFDRILFLDKNAHPAILRGSMFPVPLHLFPSLLRFHPLGLKSKFRIAYAFFHMMLAKKHLAELDSVTMLEWFRKHKQTDREIETFWRPILVSALNEDIEVASARYGIKVFLEGMLLHREAFHMGIPEVPLHHLYTRAAVDFLNRHKAALLLRSTVSEIVMDHTKVSQIQLADGSNLAGDYFVSSVPPDVLLRMLPKSFVEQNDYFAKLGHFETSPIISVYFWFDRPILDAESVALLGRTIQWVFNKKEEGYIGLVVSASRKLLPLERNEIIEIAMTDLREFFPIVREARLLRSVVIKEPFATFSCRAGCDRIRPDQRSPVENLFVAGDWTNTGWPGTMESAVRSGYRCAELILQAEGISRPILQPDLPLQGLARLL
jgi:squalene-associated FAD-dependent desaturase